MWTVLTWVVTPICIWVWGFEGVAISAFLISFTSIAPIIMVKKHVDINLFAAVKDSLAASIVMIIVGVAGISVWSRGFPEMFGGMIFTSVCYGIALYLIGKDKLTVEVQSLLRKK
jgi:hypothetical protein